MDNRPFDYYGEFFRNSKEQAFAGRNTVDNNRMVPDCIDTNYCVEGPAARNNGILTMAFVDMQPLESVYDVEKAFNRGTLFPNLDKPFYGGMR